MDVWLAADIIALYGSDKIVLVDRKYEPKGLAMPGGKVDPGETLEEAIVRELKEETNLEVKNLKQVHTYSGLYRDPRGYSVSTVFVGDVYGTPKHGDDAAALKIIGIDEIDNFKDDFAFDHYHILKDYFKK